MCTKLWGLHTLKYIFNRMVQYTLWELWEKCHGGIRVKGGKCVLPRMVKRRYEAVGDADQIDTRSQNVGFRE